MFKILLKIKTYLFLLSSFFITTTSAFAASDIRLEFNRQLVGSIGDAFLSNPLLTWSSGSFIQQAFFLCLGLALFQAVYQHYGSSGFLKEWVKISIYSMFALALLGGYDYTKLIGIDLTQGLPKEYQYTQRGAKKTLDRDVFNYLSYRFDDLAQVFEAQYGEDQYKIEMAKMTELLAGMSKAVVLCNSSDAQCIKNKLAASEQDAQKTIENEKKKEKESYIVPGMGHLIEVVDSVVNFFKQLASPTWIFQFAIWLLGLIRAFFNIFIVMVFGLIAGFSIFWCKIFTVLLILPTYRSRVISAYKLPLSTTLYGLMTSLVIAMSTVITKGLNMATYGTIISRINQNGDVGALDIMNLLFGNYMGAVAILFLQIFALAKIPKLTKSLWDLNIEALADFGKIIVEAGLGAAKIVGGAMIGAGAAAATGGLASTAALIRGDSVKQAAGQGFSKMKSTAQALGVASGMGGLTGRRGSGSSDGGFGSGGSSSPTVSISGKGTSMGLKKKDPQTQEEPSGASVVKDKDGNIIFDDFDEIKSSKSVDEKGDTVIDIEQKAKTPENKEQTEKKVHPIREKMADFADKMTDYSFKSAMVGKSASSLVGLGYDVGMGKNTGLGTIQQAVQGGLHTTHAAGKMGADVAGDVASLGYSTYGKIAVSGLDRKYSAQNQKLENLSYASSSLNNLMSEQQSKKEASDFDKKELSELTSKLEGDKINTASNEDLMKFSRLSSLPTDESLFDKTMSIKESDHYSQWNEARKQDVQSTIKSLIDENGNINEDSLIKFKELSKAGKINPAEDFDDPEVREKIKLFNSKQSQTSMESVDRMIELLTKKQRFVNDEELNKRIAELKAFKKENKS